MSDITPLPSSHAVPTVVKVGREPKRERNSRKQKQRDSNETLVADDVEQNSDSPPHVDEMA